MPGKFPYTVVLLWWWLCFYLSHIRTYLFILGDFFKISLYVPQMSLSGIAYGLCASLLIADPLNVLVTLAPSHNLLPVEVVVGWWIPPVQLL